LIGTKRTVGRPSIRFLPLQDSAHLISVRARHNKGKIRMIGERNIMRKWFTFALLGLVAGMTVGVLNL